MQTVVVNDSQNARFSNSENANDDDDHSVVSDDYSWPLEAEFSLFVKRMRIEEDILELFMKLPAFFVSLACFIYAIQILQPAAKIAMVHQQIVDHFGLKVSNIKGKVHHLEDVYAFAREFEHLNEQYVPSSALFWCESRFIQAAWDDAILAPKVSCPSPRMNALGHVTDSPTDWLTWNTTTKGGRCAPLTELSADHSSGDDGDYSDYLISVTSAEEDQHSSGKGGRRLWRGAKAGKRKASDTYKGTPRHLQANSTRVGQDPSLSAPARRGRANTSSDICDGQRSHRRLVGNSGGDGDRAECKDHDEQLAYEEGKPGLTCANAAPHVCDIPLGIRLCPKTCGYCPIFQYDRYHLYTKNVLAMLPSVVFQTRYKKKTCEHFASTYDNMPHNQDLSTLPSLDGKRQDPLLTCLNRDSLQDDTWGFMVKCPADGPEAYCKDGYMHDSHVHKYHGEPIYAKFLQEVELDIGKMQSIDWLDVQTSTVGVSTLIYTIGLEIYTSVAVEFTIDEAGNVEVENNMISFTDLLDNDKATFVVCLCVTSVVCLYEVTRQAWTLFQHRKAAKGFAFWYNFSSRIFMAGYSAALLISWSQRKPIHEEYDLLLHTVLDFHSHGPDAWETAIENYFDVKTHIYTESSWLMNHRRLCYFVLFQQLGQIIVLLSCHPRIAILTSTIQRAGDTLIHFGVVFAVLFVMLAFAAHWMLGADLQGFSTFSEALLTQSKMLYGEHLFPDEGDNLTGAMATMFWIWAFTFMIVVYLTLLNFFLAIIVEGFMEVQNVMRDSPTEYSFAYDSFDTIRALFHYRKQRWPSRREILELVELSHVGQNHTQGETKTPDKSPLIPAISALSAAEVFPSRTVLKEFMFYYRMKLGTGSHHHDDASPDPNGVQSQLNVMREEHHTVHEDVQFMIKKVKEALQGPHHRSDDTPEVCPAQVSDEPAFQHELQASVHGASPACDERDLVVAEKVELLADKSQLAEKDRLLAEKDRLLAEKDRLLAEKNLEIDRLRAKLLVVETEVYWRERTEKTKAADTTQPNIASSPSSTMPAVDENQTAILSTLPPTLPAVVREPHSQRSLLHGSGQSPTDISHGSRYRNPIIALIDSPPRESTVVSTSPVSSSGTLRLAVPRPLNPVGGRELAAFHGSGQGSTNTSDGSPYRNPILNAMAGEDKDETNV